MDDFEKAPNREGDVQKAEADRVLEKFAIVDRILVVELRSEIALRIQYLLSIFNILVETDLACTRVPYHSGTTTNRRFS